MREWIVRSLRSKLRQLALALVVGAGALALVPAASALPAPPAQDPFYSYSGSTPLIQIAPGTVLKTRTLQYHVLGIATPIKAVQLLYRTTNALGRPAVNVTSVLEPPDSKPSEDLVSYQSFYDSLNPTDEPSYQIEGGISLGGVITDVESALIAPELLQGRAVVVPDTEGEHADFAAGPEYGTDTLDSLRAAIASPATGLSGTTAIAMLGYSGGAIATEWAAQQAPTYAPDINKLLVGASMGGVLVDPAHNLNYVSGSLAWSGVMPMALIGVARAYNVSFAPYLSSYGAKVMAKLQDASIVNALGQYPGLTWQDMVKPRYANPDSVPPFVATANKLIMGENGTPTVPLLIAQGADGWLDGTNNDQAGIGPGDGVMITRDVQALAHEYCQRGVTLKYDQYDALDHIGTAVPWLLSSVSWINGRFDHRAAPDNCASVPVGNSLAPIQ